MVNVSLFVFCQHLITGSRVYLESRLSALSTASTWFYLKLKKPFPDLVWWCSFHRFWSHFRFGHSLVKNSIDRCSKDFRKVPSFSSKSVSSTSLIRKYTVEDYRTHHSGNHNNHATLLDHHHWHHYFHEKKHQHITQSSSSSNIMVIPRNIFFTIPSTDIFTRSLSTLTCTRRWTIPQTFTTLDLLTEFFWDWCKEMTVIWWFFCLAIMIMIMIMIITNARDYEINSNLLHLTSFNKISAK